MSSFLPIIKDIIPIVMPTSVHVTKSTELDEGTGQTEGMIRKGAIVNKSDKICASGELPCRSVWLLVVYPISTALSSELALVYIQYSKNRYVAPVIHQLLYIKSFICI